jgi:DNA-binding protein
VGVLIALALIVVGILFMLQRQEVVQPTQSATTPAPGVELEAPLKIHIHELYKEYKENTEAANEKWRGRLIVTVGWVRGFTKEGSLIIWAGAPVDVIIPCPFKGSERKMLEKSVRERESLLVAVSGRIASMEQRIVYGGFPLPSTYTYFELSLQDCKLVDVSKLREFEARFFMENWSVVVHNYAYSLLMWFRKADKPSPPMLYYRGMLNPFDREARVSIESAIRELSLLPGDYVLEVVNAESKEVLASWRIRIPGIEAVRVDISATGYWAPNNEHWLTWIYLRYHNPGPGPTVVFINSPTENVLELAVLTPAGERFRCVLGTQDYRVWVISVLAPGDEISDAIDVSMYCRKPISTNVKGEDIEIALIIREGGRELEIARAKYIIPPRG